MNNDMRDVVSALADMSEDELYALIGTAIDASFLAQVFMTWLGQLGMWELDRRIAPECLPVPTVTIPPEDADVSMAAAKRLRRYYGRSLPNVAALFDAIVKMHLVGERRRWIPIRSMFRVERS